MFLTRVTKKFQDYVDPTEVVPILSREYNKVVDEVNLKAPSANPTFTGSVNLPDVVMTGHTNGQVFTVNNFLCPAPGTGWTPELKGATLAASKTALKMWIPLDFLKLGDEIVSYTLLGDATEAAALTLDCKLVRVNKANPITTTDVGGGVMSQILTDGGVTSIVALTAPEVVATTKTYMLEILGTTGVGDSITITGVEVTINRK